MEDKRFLDVEGLAKLWDLICENFVDVPSHDLIMADYDAQLDAIRAAIGGEGSESIQAQIDSINNLIEQRRQATETAISNLQQKDSELEATDAALVAEDARLSGLIESNKIATDKAIADLDDKIEEEVTKLFNDIVDGAPEALDTLKEIADWIANDETGTAALINRVAALEEWQPLTATEIEDICSGLYITTKVNNANDLKTALISSNVVKLMEDVDLGSEALNINAGKNVTLNLNGKELTSSVGGQNAAINVNGGSLTIKNGSMTSTGRIAEAFNGGSITITDATVDSGDVALTASGKGSEVIIGKGAVVGSQEFGAMAFTGATVTVNGGEINARDNACLGANGSPGKGDVTINFNDGTLNAGITSAGYAACGIYMPNSGTVNVNGGQINVEKGAGIVMRAGTLNMTAGSISATDPTGAGFVGKVGDSNVTVPCAAIVYDQSAHYPGANPDGIHVNVSGGTLSSAEGLNDIYVLVDDGVEADVNDTRA